MNTPARTDARHALLQVQSLRRPSSRHLPSSHVTGSADIELHRPRGGRATSSAATVRVGSMPGECRIGRNARNDGVSRVAVLDGASS